MPNKSKSINIGKIDSSELNLILQHQLQQLPHIMSLAFFSYRENKSQKIATNVLNAPEKIEDTTKNVILVTPLEIASAAIPRVLESIIKNVKNYFNDSLYGLNVSNSEFIIPVRVKEHWLLVLLSPSKQENLTTQEISYILTFIDPAYKKNNDISKNKNMDKIYQSFAPSFIQEVKDLSSDQQTFHKEGNPWSSGHILIENVIRLINGQGLIPGESYTTEYKQNLLQKHQRILQQIYERANQTSQAQETSLKASQHHSINGNISSSKFNVYDMILYLAMLASQSNELVYKYRHGIHNNPDSIDINTIRDDLNTILFNIPMVEGLLRDNIEAIGNDNVNLTSIKNIVFEIQSNIAFILTLYVKLCAKELKKQINKEGLLVYLFFILLPIFLEKYNQEKKTHRFEPITNLQQNYENFIKYQSMIVDGKVEELTLDILLEYDAYGKDVFLCMKYVFERTTFNNPVCSEFHINRSKLPAQVDNLSVNIVAGFSQRVEIIRHVQSMRNFFDSLADVEVARKLIKDEDIANSQKSHKSDHKNIVQKKANIISFNMSNDLSLKNNAINNQEKDTVQKLSESLNDLSLQNNAINNQEKDIVQKLIESLKKTTSNDGLDLQQQLQKIINIEIIAKDRNLIISQGKRLELASCLILSLLFLNKNISDILQASALMDKVEELCSNVDENNEAMKLNALIFKADLYSTLCLILDTNCNKAKYDLVKQEHDRLKIICTVKNAEQRFVLIQQYTESIDKMQGYISEINSILANLPYPENPDGLLFSLEEYDSRIKAYDVTLQYYEEQDKLAELQRENFKRDFENGLIKPRANGEPSNASLVQKKLSEQKQELANNPIISMKEIHAKCEDAVNNLNKIVTNKVNKTSQVSVKPELEYLETSNSWQQESKIVTGKANKTSSVSVKQEFKYLETLHSWQQERNRRHSFDGEIKSDDFFQQETRSWSNSL
jgi:hypothetical protein